MSTLEEVYQARQDATGAGGKVLQDNLTLLSPQEFTQAYSAAHENKYGVKPRIPMFDGDVASQPPALPTVMPTARPQNRAMEFATEKPVSDYQLLPNEQNTPARYAAVAFEGLMHAGMEITKTATELANFAIEHGYEEEQLNGHGALIPPMGPTPEIVPNKSMSENVVGGIAQFTAPYLATVKAFDAMQIFKAADTASPMARLGLEVTKDAIASIPVDFAAFDPHDNNIADMVSALAKQHGFEAEWLDFLKSSPADGTAGTALENRAKAAIANLPVNGALGVAVSKVKDGAVKAFMLSAKAVRAMKMADWAQVENRAATDLEKAKQPGRLNDIGGAVQQGGQQLSAAVRLVASRMMRKMQYTDALEGLTPEQKVEVVDKATAEAGTGALKSTVDPKDVLSKKDYTMSGLGILRGEEVPPPEVQGIAGATQFLQERATKSLGEEAGASTPKAQKRIARLLAAHVAEAISKTGNAASWYRDKLQLAHAIVAQKHPEIKTDPQQATAFNYALAVTSNGQDVAKNAKLALDAYEAFKATGKFPEKGVGKESAAMASHFKLWNQMTDELGHETWMKFLNTDWSVRELEAMGFSVGGEGPTTRVPGAAVLGPKIGGAFFANLQGDMSRLTMDRWWERMFRSFKGDLKYGPEIVATRAERLRKSLDIPGVEPLAQKYAGMSVDEIKALDDPELVRTASRIYTRWGQDKSSGTGGGHPLSGTPADEFMRSVRELHQGAVEPIGSPEGAAARDFRRATTQDALKILKNTYGIETDPADLQALVWYPTKELWAKLGVRDANSAPTDYAAEFDKLLKEQGYAGTSDPTLGPESHGQGDSRVTFEQKQQSGFRATRIARELSGRFGAADAGLKPGYGPRKAAGRVAGVVKGEELRGALIAPEKALKNALDTAQLAAPNLVEVQAPEAFNKAISKAKKSQGAKGAAVTVYDPSEYANARTFLTEDGKAGFALKGDDIVSVFNTQGGPHRGASLSMLHAAIALGGRRLDCFNTELPRLYRDAGMRPVARLKWNPEYAPPGWDRAAMVNYQGGEPDVVFMVYDPKAAPKSKVEDAPYVDDYDAGIAKQTEALKP